MGMMVANRSLTIRSERYFPENDRYSDDPYTTQDLSIDIDVTQNIVEFDYVKRKHERVNEIVSKSYLFLQLERDNFLSLLRFFAEKKPEYRGEKTYTDVEVISGQNIIQKEIVEQSDRHEKRNYDIENIHLEANNDRIVIETFKEQNPVVPYCEIEHGSEKQDRKNIERVSEFVSDIVDKIAESESTPEMEPIDESIQQRLRSIENGEEVIKHVKEGDECIKNSLLHPAMNCYIHAIEWSIISYLKESDDTDIIEKEKNGHYYNFAAGQNNLLDELSESVDIDQKTYSKIKSMNQAERRWSAHHKSGKLTFSEIKAIRSRLKLLLEKLFT